MIIGQCLKKFRGTYGDIIGYQILLPGNMIQQYEAYELKGMIERGQIEITNLQLTVDGRLIDKKDRMRCSIHMKKELSREQNIKNYIAKCKVLGKELDTIPTSCGNPCYIIPLNDVLGVSQYIIYIPDNVTVLNYSPSRFSKKFTIELKKYILDLEKVCNLYFIGGHKLKDTSFMFYDCSINHISLKELDTSKVEIGQAMFFRTRTEMLFIENMNTSNMRDMSSMFREYRSGESILNLKSFDTSNVRDMSRMFKDCSLGDIDLNSFNTENVKDMSEMFYGFSGTTISMQKANTTNVKNMQDIFTNCRAFIDTKDTRLNEEYEERWRV